MGSWSLRIGFKNCCYLFQKISNSECVYFCLFRYRFYCFRGRGWSASANNRKTSCLLSSFQSRWSCSRPVDSRSRFGSQSARSLFDAASWSGRSSLQLHDSAGVSVYEWNKTDGHHREGMFEKKTSVVFFFFFLIDEMIFIDCRICKPAKSSFIWKGPTWWCRRLCSTRTG